MLRLRLVVEDHRADSVAEALEKTGGVHRIVALTPERGEASIVLAADVIPSAADQVMGLITEWRVPESDYLLTRQEVIAPHPAHGGFREPSEFAWVEVMGEANVHSRPLGRFLALMAVAAVVAALGVTTGNAILIVGAMAVSPDLLPICATCVGIVAGRPGLAWRASVTLVLGLGLVVGVAALLSAALLATGFLEESFNVGESGLKTLVAIDYSTVLVAAAAGVAAMLAFETRAAAAVGVAISVTTIPASAYLGVAVGLGEIGEAGSAAAVLAINVTLLIVSGSLTLLLQRWMAARRTLRRPTA